MIQSSTKKTVTVIRKVCRIVTVPPAGPGFDGPAHTAAAVFRPDNFATTDPFFLMMDDRISVAGPFGGAHPHAGLETVTFMLKGSLKDLGGELQEGDVEWMTAGSGIVHSEDAVASEGMRLLQLWVVLPADQGHMPPRIQFLSGHRMPLRCGAGFEARIYSGQSGGITADTINAVPVTLIDVRLQPGASFEQELPVSFTGFLLTLEGEVAVGDPRLLLEEGQVGWLDPAPAVGSVLTVSGGKTAARFLLYAGQRQDLTLSASGPFIAGSPEQLAAYFVEYRRGAFPYASTIRPPTN